MTPAEERAVALLDHDLDGDEGTVPFAYADHLGYLTIGRGILIDQRKGGKLLPEEIAFINQNRIALVLRDCQREAWYPAVASDPVRLCAVMNMTFQMGEQVDEKFAATFALIAKRDWKSAASNLRKSLWARQTPKRAERVIRMIETGART